MVKIANGNVWPCTYTNKSLPGMDWWIPGYNEALAKQLIEYHGNITAENTIQYILPRVQTGDLHVAVYDLPKGLLYVANARADSETGPRNAYQRYPHMVVLYLPPVLFGTFYRL